MSVIKVDLIRVVIVIDLVYAELKFVSKISNISYVYSLDKTIFL